MDNVQFYSMILIGSDGKQFVRVVPIIHTGLAGRKRQGYSGSRDEGIRRGK